MSQFREYGFGNKNSVVQVMQEVRVAQAIEILKRAGIGNNDHEGYYLI